MSIKPTSIFVNFPVEDLNRSVSFFTKLGFTFNPQFTDENATCMVINESIFAMLLVKPFFKSFIQKEIADATTTAEVILALSVESRKEVDELVDTALSAGAVIYSDTIEMDYMYSRNFQDLDGHMWEIVYMDPKGFEV